MQLQYKDDALTLIESALKEDLGTGDITTLSVISPDRTAHGIFKAKEDGVICGLDLISMVYQMLSPDVDIVFHVSDGDYIHRGDVIAEVSGRAQTMLSGERVALNLVQHLSGIATATHKAVSMVEGLPVKIVDTRKTTPGMRVLEKYAVRVGGGYNHRFGLADGILIKDNHIAAAGGITQAIQMAKKYAPHTLKVEVEVETMEQVNEALAAGADIIMLDNMSVYDMKASVDVIAGRALTEASGNMGERDLREVGETGVDFISIGALTHSVKALDISLKFTLN
ncbi:MAG: carboxylating nicotinate-nucleotide diphosphorylase [Clostridia bacterium]|nr:carboxylating nicotinate-nucleotide diphosphorylase [Clostridia bacterium]